MGALISKLCLHWASVYQLVVQRLLWHWTRPVNSLLNRVSSHREPMYVKRTLLQWERGQTGNMLVIVVSCHRASMEPLYFCWSHRYVTWSWCGLHFQPPPRSCSQWVSLMTRLIPLMRAAGCVQAPCSSDALRNKQFACRGLANDRCCSALELWDRMWLWLNTQRHWLSDKMHQICQDVAHFQLKKIIEVKFFFYRVNPSLVQQ